MKLLIERNTQFFWFFFLPQCLSESQRGQFVASCCHPRPKHSRTGIMKGKKPPPTHIYGQDICQHTHRSPTKSHTQCEHRLTRETWAHRQSVTTSRKEKILEDRLGCFRDPDPPLPKAPLQ